MKITSRLEYRYTTNPADMGYDGRPSSWKADGPDCVGTPQTISSRIDHLRRLAGLGQGVYYREEIRDRKTGAIYSRKDLQNFLIGLEYDKLVARGKL